MKRKLLTALKDEAGYVTALALIAMPLLLGFSLLVIDVARGNNLHTDLQNAVDALALAGARELDGGEDAIDRSNAAIADLLNNEARFVDGGGIIVDESQVTVTYLDAIPADDDTRIDDAWIDAHGTTDGGEADFVLVRSNQEPMTSLFPVPVGWTQDTVNFQAEAVATYDVSACDVTPLFICNPFENDGSGLTFEESFGQGKLYARQMTLSFNGGTAIGPGNFGWLEVASPGGNALRDALASGKPGVCYAQDGLTTKTGGTIGPAEQGINVRFDIYAGSMSNSDPANRPAVNIRKGARNPNSSCNSYTEETDPTQAMAFPSSSLTGQGQYGNQTLQGGTISGEVWDLPAYWNINHPGVSLPDIPESSYPGTPPENGVPSRYDVYRYEIENDPQLIAGADNTAPNGETGAPQCYQGDSAGITDEPDRRVVFAAVVNCQSVSFSGQTTFTDPESFVSMFLTKPMTTSGNTKTVSVEVIDVTGNSGNGTLDTFLREESFLVR